MSSTNNSLKIGAKESFFELGNTVEKIIKEFRSYMDTFEQKDFFSFSETEIKKKYYKDKYHTLTSKLVPLMTAMDKSISTIASLLIKADRAMDYEMISKLQSVFDFYSLLEKEIYEYTVVMEKEFQRERTSLSVLLDSSKRVTSIFIVLSNKIKNAEN